MLSRTNRTDPSQKRNWHPPGCGPRNPLTKSRPDAFDPDVSDPHTVGVPGRRFIGSSRGSGGRPSWAVVASTLPYHGCDGSPNPVAPHDCSSSAACPVNGSATGCPGDVSDRIGYRFVPPDASPIANVVEVPSVMSAIRVVPVIVPSDRRRAMPNTPRAAGGTRLTSA